MILIGIFCCQNILLVSLLSLMLLCLYIFFECRMMEMLMNPSTNWMMKTPMARQMMPRSRHETAHHLRHRILPRQALQAPRNLAATGLGPGNHGNGLPIGQVRVTLGFFNDGCVVCWTIICVIIESMVSFGASQI